MGERDFIVADGEGEEEYDDDGEVGLRRQPSPLIRKKRAEPLRAPAAPAPAGGVKPKSATIDIDFGKLRGGYRVPKFHISNLKLQRHYLHGATMK